MIEDREINERLRRYYAEVNRVGLGELLLFGKGFELFVEKESQRSRILKAVTNMCRYETSAREFARCVSYDDFRSLRGITEVGALGLRLYLLYQCGVDWLRPYSEVKGF